MGGKGSGRKPGYKLTEEQKKAYRNNGRKSPMTQAAHRNVDPEVNSHTIRYAMDLMKVEPGDLTSAEDVDRAFFDYLEVCDRNAIRPNVAGLCTCYGMSRGMFYHVTHDVEKPGQPWTPEGIAELKKCYTYLNTLMEAEMLDEKGNPAKYIFLAKNNFDYVDQKQNVVVHKNAADEVTDPKLVAAKYADMVELPEGGKDGESGKS